MQVAVGDTVTMKDWQGEWIDVKVRNLGNSPTYGDTVEGLELDPKAGVGAKFVALPLAHLVEVVQAKNVKHGRWELTLPDGANVYVASRAKAKEFAEKNGYVLREA